MKVNKSGIPSILPDNEMLYLSHIIKCISILDTESELSVSKTNSGYRFNLRPSQDTSKDLMMRQIAAAHEALGLDVQFSSYKESPYISFNLVAR